ncbi:CDGSH iron-sulfur domain-containing protein [Archangium sp.]|uniref:CDGSH iron-sulfur domain-containing protein n=1 Tax=Archangium sp. TaxID=1872627 RepID=UPI002D2F839E|nr:CDGSH iron-sulfur domain-containing protein [Archangium sp.]HYO56142.1 CDGSH iron-sulfur domain-containing protein [Archangium sp.]
MSDTTITALKNGPLLIKESVKIIDGATGQELPVARLPVALCRCGQSGNKPFCDGMHGKVGFDGTCARQNP